MKKHFVSLAAGVLAVASLSACGTGGNNQAEKARTLTDVKVGLICLHDNNSTYDKNFIDSINNAVANTGLAEGQLIVKTNIAESDACKTAAEELVQAGCDLIIADSFGHEPYLLQVAKDNPTKQFLHCTGTTAHTENVENFHNAFASIYEGRFLAGVAAGLKLKAMKDADPNVKSKVGYVGAFTYAEVISGYTAWYLGVKSIVNDVTMDVRFTGSWYDLNGEKTAAEALINDGAVIVSQHADSMGAPNACEEHNVPNVSYNGSTFEACPNTFLVSSRIDWTPCFENYIMEIADAKKNNRPVELQSDFVGTIPTGSVKLTDTGSACAPRTQAYIDVGLGQLAQMHSITNLVFSTDRFTVKNAWEADTKGTGIRARATIDENYHLTSYLADVDTDQEFTPDTNVITTLPGGFGASFMESYFRSAPYFDVQIDGITLKNTAF